LALLRWRRAESGASADHGGRATDHRAGYTDTSDNAGTGFLPTYPADRIWGRLIGIDHILVSDDLVGVDGGGARLAAPERTTDDSADSDSAR
jgi:hypothetical protein